MKLSSDGSPKPKLQVCDRCGGAVRMYVASGQNLAKQVVGGRSSRNPIKEMFLRIICAREASLASVRCGAGRLSQVGY